MAGDYTTALEAAGAIVQEYEIFGSYQGDWLAIVEYEGEIKVVHGSYGSCSGCDAFEGTFGHLSHTHLGEEWWSDFDLLKIDGRCQQCLALATQLRHFGMDYLEGAMSFEDALIDVSRNASWDLDAKYMIEWVRVRALELGTVLPDPVMCERCGDRVVAKVGDTCEYCGWQKDE